MENIIIMYMLLLHSVMPKVSMSNLYNRVKMYISCKLYWPNGYKKKF